MLHPPTIQAFFDHALPVLFTLGIIAVGIYLFLKEFFTIDVTAMLIMAMFIVTSVLAPEEGFAGFTNAATITVACMFVLSFGLFNSGVLDPLIRILIRIGRWHFLAALFALMVFAATLSAFINDTAVVALLLPATLRLAERTGVHPGKLLMPLSFAALLGGVCTLIGTSTNILVSGIVAQHGFAPLGMFEFAPAAIWITLVGMAYLLTIGIGLLPARVTEVEDVEPVTRFVARVRLGKECKDVGKALSASALVKEFRAEVLELRRADGTLVREANDGVTLHAGDVVKVAAERENLRELRHATGVKMVTERTMPHEGNDLRLYEVVIPRGSKLAGSTLASWYYQRDLEHGLIGMLRNDGVLAEDPEQDVFAEGDILLLPNTSSAMFNLIKDGALTVIDEYEIKRIDVRKAVLASGILAGVIGVAALGFAPIVITAMVGVLALLLTRVVSPEDAYRAVEWKVIFLLAGVLSMGAALQKTGTDQLVANGLYHVFGSGSPLVALGAVILITSLSTNIMSNNATAALMTPISLQLASSMGVNERPFIIAVLISASLAFMTPMSYQTNSMVYVPGNYRFNDYLKVGTPLNVIAWIVAMFVIPKYFPF
ncbi:MAG: SLC13 family permease [Flavobacteriales bacterium]|nr:SLC13 family permease [Flavobacteriales bacterium]